MPSKYCVFQYVPDTSIGERVNFGVLAFDETNIQVHFIENWERIRRFSPHEIDFLQDFAAEIEKAAGIQTFMEEINGVEPLTVKSIDDMCGWIHSIQLTLPRGSLDDLQETFDWAVTRFLVERQHVHREYRNRQKAASIIKLTVRDALCAQMDRAHADRLLNATDELPGRVKPHSFDTIVKNGRPYYAAHGVSFELPVANQLEPQIELITWKISDVKDSLTELPIGILTLPPNSQSGKKAHELYRDTVQIYKNIGAVVLTEKNAEDWAHSMVKLLPDSVKVHE